MPHLRSVERPERSVDVTRKREALEELLTSQGWQYYRAHLLREWQGAGYQARMRAALSKDLVEAKVIDRVAQEILRLLQWPGDAVRELKGSVDNE